MTVRLMAVACVESDARLTWCLARVNPGTQPITYFEAIDGQRRLPVDGPHRGKFTSNDAGYVPPEWS